MDRWGRLAWVAARQHGVVTVAQAAEVGITRDAMARRARDQRWIRMHPGVYVMPGHPDTHERPLMAGLLFLGRGAVLGVRSAGHLWGLIDQPPLVPEYLVPHERRRGRAGVVKVIRSRTLERKDITSIGPLVVTRIDRTLCDLAAILSEDDLREAVARAGQRSVDWPRRVAIRTAQLPALPGRTLLMAAVRDVLGEGRTDSVLERRARTLLKRHGLHPAPGVYPLVVQGRLIAMLDIAFPDHRVAIEVDGFAHHASPAQLRADHARQNRIVAAGWTVLRVGAQELAGGSPELVSALRRLGVLRRSGGSRSTAATQ